MNDISAKLLYAAIIAGVIIALAAPAGTVASASVPHTHVAAAR